MLLDSLQFPHLEEEERWIIQRLVEWAASGMMWPSSPMSQVDPLTGALVTLKHRPAIERTPAP
jgi:hypothetical protein